MNYDVQRDSVVVLLNARASAININVLHDGQSVFTRDLATGGNAFTEALQKELSLGFDEAGQLKQGVPINGVTYDDAEPVIRAVTENLLMEIGKTFDFFRATAPSDRVDTIVLSGGTSRIPGFPEALAARFDTDVEQFDPFRRLAIDPAQVTGDRRAEVGPLVAVAVGLALRRADDR